MVADDFFMGGEKWSSFQPLRRAEPSSACQVREMATHSSKVAHKTGPHHLSQQSLLKDGGASDGWVESLTSLTESVQATQLLDEEAAHATACSVPHPLRVP